MKSIDVDAKQLIRTYVDGIEEYLRKHTRLHPNEVDGLLNEINDFVYLRSGELASGEKVQYNDVLKAIEECGSPSEICEQYLELDKGEEIERFKPKAQGFISKLPTKEKLKDRFQLSKTTKEEKHYGPVSSPQSFSEIRAYYSYIPSFGLYRVFSLLFIGWIILALLYMNPLFQGITYFGSYGNDLRVSTDYIYSLSANWCYSVAMIALIVVVWEGWGVNLWKTRLVEQKGIDRRFDDSLIVGISRLTFLVVFFRSSLLLINTYLLFIPIWLILAGIIERQMQSQLWQEKIGPWLVSIGSNLTNSHTDQTMDQNLSYFARITNQLTKQEKAIIAIILGTFVVSFGFPWIGIWQRDGYYVVSSLPVGASMIVYFSLGVMLAIVWYIRHYRIKNPHLVPKSFSGESELIAWLMRLLALKLILIVSFFTHLGNSELTANYFGSLCVLGVLVVSEIVLNTYGGKTFRSWFSKGLVMLASSGSREPSPHKFQADPTDYSTDSSLPSPTKNTSPVMSNDSYSSNVLKEEKPLEFIPKREPEPSSVFVEKTKTKSEERFFFTIIKTFFMVILMLGVSFYEVVLGSIVLLTSFGLGGGFYVPIFVFNFPPEWFGFSQLKIGGYMIWFGYALFLLGIQLFVVITLELYGVARKQPDGVVVKAGRNLSRIFLFVVLIGALYQISCGDLYAPLFLVIILGLIVFSEISAWKARAERRRWNIQSTSVLTEDSSSLAESL